MKSKKTSHSPTLHHVVDVKGSSDELLTDEPAPCSVKTITAVLATRFTLLQKAGQVTRQQVSLNLEQFFNLNFNFYILF